MGLDSLISQLRQRVGAASERIEKKALKAAGQVLADEMIERVAVSRINYRLHTRDHIKVSGVKRQDGVRYVTIGPSRKVSFRSHFIEFGTSTQGARPFIEPAFQAKKQEVLEVMAAELRRGLES